MSGAARDLRPAELDALALLIEHHRTRAGHEPWDRDAIAAQLVTLDHDWPTTLAVALSAASDPRATSAHAITWPRHQPTPGRGSTSKTTSSGPTCRTCHLPEPACRRMAARTGDPHTFETRSTR